MSQAIEGACICRGKTGAKRLIWKKEKSITRKLKKFPNPGENQTHNPPSSSLDAFTIDSRHNILWLFVRISMLITS